MKKIGSVLSSAVLASAPLLGAFTGAAWAQQAPALINPVGASDAPQQPSAAISPAETGEEIPLGHSYESQSAGVSFRPPADCRLVDSISSKYIAEWVDPDRDWTLKLGKMVLDQPAPLLSGKDNFGKDIEGILDKTVRNLKASLPGSVILRQDVTNTRDGGPVDSRHPQSRDNVGLIAIRYTNADVTHLSQQAIIAANDNLYYLLTLTTPGKRSADNPHDDPAEVQAVETFSRMLDSVRLLDRKAIKQDQDDRLYRARSVIVNWTPSRLHSVLINEQWLRIIKNGKDIGYSYITEDQAGAIPRPLTREELKDGKRELDLVRGKPGDGVLIGVRARIVTDGMRSDKTKGPIQTDSASWFFVSIDKRHEDFSRVVVTDDRIAPKKGYIQEFGVGENRVRRYFEKPQADPNEQGLIQPNRDPIPVLRESWELDVTQTSNIGMAAPLNRKLSPWYIPQALAHLLPRLLPLNKPQKYLFADYVSDAREVMMRYIDVLPDQMVSFSGRLVRAVPIQDRLGLEGPITTHYMTLDGIYLGSENKEQKLVMLPTDSVTLQNIWKDADLTHPSAIQRPGPANADNVPAR